MIDKKPHIVIGGTGRAGTSLLVCLLTRLGLETGFTEADLRLHETSRAGLEHDMRDVGNAPLPEVVKDPRFMKYADWALKNYDIRAVIVPIRQVSQAAESRRQVWKENQRLGSVIHGGGLFDGGNPEDQEEKLMKHFYNMMLKCSEHHVPVILINYPKLATDKKYTKEKLTTIAGLIAEKFYEDFIDDVFDEVWGATIRKDWVRTYLTDKSSSE